MKRLISFLIVFVLMLSLVACGDSSEQKGAAEEESYVPETSQPDTMPTPPPTPTPTPVPTSANESEGMRHHESEDANRATDDASMSSSDVYSGAEVDPPQATPEPATPDDYEDHSILTPYAKDKISEAGQKFVEGCDEFGHFMGDKLGEGIEWAKDKYENATTQNDSTESEE